MLRHYDDVGLLKPAETDDFTGYRYYREDQLFTIARITALRDMGFSLAEIVKMLDIYEDADKLEAYLAKRKEELDALAAQTEYQRMLLDSARMRLRKEQIMNFDVTVKTIPERYAATVQMISNASPHLNTVADGMYWPNSSANRRVLFRLFILPRRVFRFLSLSPSQCRRSNLQCWAG